MNRPDDQAPTAPFSNPTTSLDAAREIDPFVTRLASKVFAYVCSLGGATCWEVEQGLGMSHQTASARLHELANKEPAPFLRDSGKRRKTATGRGAIVWVPVYVRTRTPAPSFEDIRCSVCRRLLTHPLSRAAGVGPTCSSRKQVKHHRQLSMPMILE